VDRAAEEGVDVRRDQFHTYGQWNDPGSFPVGSFAENLAHDGAVAQIDWVAVSEKKSIDPALCD